MLDQENLNTSDSAASGSPAEGAEPTKAKATKAAKAPAKRAARPRKATAKAAANPEPAPAEPELAAATTAAPAPAVKKAAARKSAKKAAPAVAVPAAAVPAPVLSVDVEAAAVAPPVAKAAKRARKAVSASAEPALALPADSEPAAPATRRRRKATANVTDTAGLTDSAADTAATDAATIQPAGSAPALVAPSVLFVAPTAPAATDAPATPPRRRARKATAAVTTAAGPAVDDAQLSLSTEIDPDATLDGPEHDEPESLIGDELAAELDGEPEDDETDAVREAAAEQATGARRRRRRGRRGRGRPSEGGDDAADSTDSDSTGDSTGDATADGDLSLDGAESADSAADSAADGAESLGDEPGTGSSRRRRRRRSGGGGGAGGDVDSDDPPNTVVHVRERRGNTGAGSGAGEGSDSGDDGVRGVKGSTRLEAKRQRRRDGRDSGRRRPSILSEAEFLARREAVDRVMAVRQLGDRTQIAVLEDDVLVEHYVTRASATSYVGNVYLGRVQNVLPSMEAAFVDIGKGRNGVLYAGEVNWDAAGLDGKSRAIENAMRGGDTVLVQVTKDPIGHKGARLTSQVSLPGRFLVYVPGGGMTGISRKLPDTERQRLKAILKKIVPEDAGVIIRTAAEGASEEELTHDVERLKAEWESISAKAESATKKNSGPALVHGEPDLAIRVVRDVFNEDFTRLIVQGEDAWNTISGYLNDIAPELAARASRHTAESDLFHDLRVDEGLAKALDRKVYLPSGGSLVIDRTEAMTVVDVNTGKFVGSGGNLEQTVTRNNLEAAEEIVRQLRLRDVGGIVVIDFIDMVLESNRDLVLRRLTECLGRDRTKHQVAEVTSLGLVQMTRKRVGEGLIEAFSETCEVCRGRGVIIHAEPVDQHEQAESHDDERQPRKRGSRRGGAKAPVVEEDVDPAVEEERRRTAAIAMAAIHRAAAAEGEELSEELSDALAQAASALEGTDLVEAATHDEAADAEAADPEATDADAETLAVAAAEAPTEPSEPTQSAEPTSRRPAYKTTFIGQDAPSDIGQDAPSGADGVSGADSVSDATFAAGEPAPAPAAAPVRRRRRAASRPAGPPVAAS